MIMTILMCYIVKIHKATFLKYMIWLWKVACKSQRYLGTAMLETDTLRDTLFEILIGFREQLVLDLQPKRMLKQ